ncbi:MAG TPA: site-specific tyrosine recombinase/integron integrase [Bacteroidales bacterium]|nr:site-specific tyrosine recombinase/integron integrase [Bacteroidales bacterium]
MRHFGDFLQYIQYIRQYSPHTVQSYKKDLEQFCVFCNYTHDQHESVIDHRQIRNWIIELMETGHSARSVNRKISALKTYFRYLMKEGIVTNNPVNKVLSPKSEKKLPAFVKENEMDHLLDDTGFEGGYTGLRNRTIIETFYNTGMRISELINLKVSDIDFSKETIKVLGKRNKERIIPFSRLFSDVLQQYSEARSTMAPEGEWFFVTAKGVKMYPRLVYRVVRNYLTLVTTSDKKSPHVLRHTFATHMLNHGADLNAIKELLGHANLSATEVYTHNTFEKLKSVYKQAHPRA